MKCLRAGDKNYSTVQFEWFLTNWCNYQCAYCSEADNMKDKFSPGKYKLVLARLQTIESPFAVELIGGEPTLHPHLDEILESLNNNPLCTRVEVVTNLSRPLKFYQALNLPKVSILASFHPQYYTKDFLDKIIHFADARVTLNLSDNPDYWDLTETAIKDFDRCGVKYAFNILNTTSAYKTNYTDNFYRRFEPYIAKGRHNQSIAYEFENCIGFYNESEILKQGLDRFKGYTCTPIRYRIDDEGNISNYCTQRVIPMTLNNDSIIRKEVCPNDYCKCDALYIFHKEQI